MTVGKFGWWFLGGFGSAMVGSAFGLDAWQTIAVWVPSVVGYALAQVAGDRP